MILATPGPVEVPFFVREAGLKETIHHRTPEFKAILKDTIEKYQKLISMQETVFLASSGTGAMEACVTNLVKSKALYINAGKFGERWGKICDAHAIEKTEIKLEWNVPASKEEVLSLVKADEKIDTFFIQISESAGGLRHPVEEIAQAIKEYNENILVVADGITAVGVESIDTTHIDAIVAGSQKALMLDPGLAILSLSAKAVERIGKGKGYYFNLANEIKKHKEFTTAFTPASGLIRGLNTVLTKLIDEVGIDTLHSDTKKRHKALKEAVVVLGLDIYPNSPAKSMVAIYSKEAEKIRKVLKEEFSIQVAGGQDHLKGALFRINNMGLIEERNMQYIVNALELTLETLGLRSYDGSALKAYTKARL